jgi:hypothetical protein
MFECKTCGRKFKTMQELGGHTSSAHPKPGEPSATVTEGEPALAAELAESAEKQPDDARLSEKQPGTETHEVTHSGAEGNAEDGEPSIADQIRDYRSQGLTFKQLVNDLGFKESTVRDVISKELVAENKAQEEKTSTLPLVIKNGKGEMIAPEAVIWQMAVEEGVDGERDFKALMKWAAAIEMVHRMTEIRKSEAEALAATAKPVLEMMEKSREELDAAVARAKESSMAIAEAAAAGAAARATMHIDGRINELKEVRKEKADIATVQDPITGLIARTLETMMNRFTGMAFGGNAGGSAPSNPGLVDRRIQQGG